MSATAAVFLLALTLHPRLPAGPLPHVPSGPNAGDLAEGWAAGLDAIEPRVGVDVPWLKSATAARLFIHELPSEPPRARPRLVEAAAMILARHGRTYEQPAWDDWFRGLPWYQPRRDFSPGLLSEGEQEALGLLLQAWERLQPGGPTKR